MKDPHNNIGRRFDSLSHGRPWRVVEWLGCGLYLCEHDDGQSEIIPLTAMTNLEGQA